MLKTVVSFKVELHRIDIFYIQNSSLNEFDLTIDGIKILNILCDISYVTLNHQKDNSS